nr:hypothetical protein [Klebsiella oxytoca]
MNPEADWEQWGCLHPAGLQETTENPEAKLRTTGLSYSCQATVSERDSLGLTANNGVVFGEIK